MKKYIFVLISIMLLLSSSLCGATVIDFEDLYTGVNIKEALPADYAGVTWSDNAHYYTSNRVNDTYLKGTGYEYGMFGNVAIVNSGATELSITFDARYDFSGAYITSAWLVNQSVTVEGWDGDTRLYSETIVTSYNDPYYFDYLYEGINKLLFVPGGGEAAGFAYETSHIILDNIDPVETQNGTLVPEPYSILLIGLGLLGIAMFRKKFK